MQVANSRSATLTLVVKKLSQERRLWLERHRRSSALSKLRQRAKACAAASFIPGQNLRDVCLLLRVTEMRSVLLQRYSTS
jgi:hypothetical protein